jgi:hypothetical protein
LLARLNEDLSITIANGTYDELYDKWFGPIPPPTPSSATPSARIVSKGSIRNMRPLRNSNCTLV